MRVTATKINEIRGIRSIDDGNWSFTERYAISSSRVMKGHRRHLVHRYSSNRSHRMSGKDHLIAPLVTPWKSYRGDGDKPRQWPIQVHEASAVLEESGTVVLVLDSSPCPRPFPALEVVVTVARVVDGLLGFTDAVGCED